MSSPLLVDPVIVAAAKLLACLDDTLTANDAAVCRTGLVPGTSAPADVCCECEGVGEGQATVRVVQVYPTANFPQPIQVPAACDVTGLVAVLEMCVYRCAHVMDDSGTPPTPEDVTADAIQASRDGLLMRRAVRCCFQLDELGDDDPDVLIGSWQPIEPGGGCHGGTVLVTVRVDDCRC